MPRDDYSGCLSAVVMGIAIFIGVPYGIGLWSKHKDAAKAEALRLVREDVERNFERYISRELPTPETHLRHLYSEVNHRIELFGFKQSDPDLRAKSPFQRWELFAKKRSQALALIAEIESNMSADLAACGSEQVFSDPCEEMVANHYCLAYGKCDEGGLELLEIQSLEEGLIEDEIGEYCADNREDFCL